MHDREFIEFLKKRAAQETDRKTTPMADMERCMAWGEIRALIESHLTTKGESHG